MGYLVKIIVAVVLGLGCMTGCDQAQETQTPAQKPKLVSKAISIPQSPKDEVAKEQNIKDPPQKDAAPAALVVQPTDLGAGEGEAIVQDGTRPALNPDFGSNTNLGPDPVVNGAALKVAMTPAYDAKGRVDPFIPLLSEKETKQDKAADQAEDVPQRVLTPLEKMELSQIKLVAVIEMKDRSMAMVEEASGKGYEVQVGTYMGRHQGQVTAIRPDSIVVKEYYQDFQGKRRERLQEIKFHKNQDGE